MESLLNHPALSRLAFFPRRTAISDPFQIVCDDGVHLDCYHREVSPKAKTIVFFHGNGEIVADYVGLLPRLFEIIGCNSFLVEYRGYASSGGSPGLGHMLADCRAIVDQIPADPENRIYFGRSLGCLQAVEAASQTPEACGLLLESGVANLYRYVSWLLGQSNGDDDKSSVYPLTYQERIRLQAEIALKADVLAKVAKFNGFGLVAYSLWDLDFRQAEAESLFQAISGTKRILRLANADHNSLISANLMTYCDYMLKMANDKFVADYVSGD
jgi:pimeloyl-ACP methyl ester carboxylesterase